jgi:hypothetical protein
MNYPDRCQHIKINGTQCGSPALRRQRFCFFHKRFQDERIRLARDRARHGTGTFILPVLEDANSIQMALMQVMRLLVTKQIEPETARLLLSALRTASSNLRHAEFNPRYHKVVLSPQDAANTFLGEDVWDDDDFEEDEEEEEEPETPVRHAKPAPGKTKPAAASPTKSAAPGKKPAASSDPAQVREEINAMVRRDLVPSPIGQQVLRQQQEKQAT